LPGGARVSPRRLLRSRFLKDSAILQASGGLTAVMQLASSAVLAKVIGEHLQGIYITALSLYGAVFMLLNTGVVQAAVTQIAAAAAREQIDKVASWLAFLVKIYALGGLFLLAVGGWFLPSLGTFFADDRHVGVLAWWLALTPLLELPRVVAYTTFQASRRMADLARLELGTELARLVLVTAGALTTRDAFGPILGTVASTAVGSLLGIALYRRAAAAQEHKLPGLRLILARVRDVPIRRGLHLGLRIGALRSLDAFAFTLLPPLFIQLAGRMAGNTQTDAYVTYFRVAQSIVKIPVIALQGVSRTALPALSKLAGLRDAEGFRRNFLKVTLWSGVITATGVVATLLPIPYVVPIFWRESYAAPVARLAAILALGYGVIGFTVALDSFYILANRLRVAIVFSTIFMLVSFPTQFLLIRWLPETGAAWGMVLNFSWFVVHLTYIHLYFRRGEHLRAFGAAPAPERPAEA
ncbi:MAG TPA: oligosaccharide flippase family protein, partial [Planctomycetota bacterium]|nr:oligosaccharide flippase family protein [Planctomycetota bacterium]